MTTDAGQARAALLPALVDLLARATDPIAVLPSVVEVVLRATAADACFVHRWEERRGSLMLVAASPPYRDMVGRVQLAKGEGMAGWVAQHRKPAVIVRDKWSDPRYKYISALGGDLYTSMASVPVIAAGGRLLGVINIHTVAERTFEGEELEFLTSAASLVGSALENAELFARLVEKEHELQQLLDRTVSAQENERRRLAVEIHDGVTQHVIAAMYRLQAARAANTLAGATSDIDVALSHLTEADEESRRAIGDLRPPALDLGLVPALETLLDRLRNEEGIHVELRAGGMLTQDADSILVIYRVVQEAVANVLRHAGASKVAVSVDGGPDFLTVEFVDDGRGFAPGQVRPKAVGLIGMRERVEAFRGTLDIESEPGTGVRIRVRLPT